ncbi:MAG TPA: exosortase [Opitutaceae bacterium]|jgi:exosortase C (VPDSG-CTERM-specific)
MRTIPPRLKALALVGALLVAGYSVVLLRLARLAWSSDLYSYILLVPLVSGYLVWIRRADLLRPAEPSPAFGAAVGAMGVALLLLDYHFGGGRSPDAVNSIALETASLLLVGTSAGAWLLGAACLRRLLFPLAFLILVIPIPTFLVGRIQHLLQTGSAAVAYAFFRISGTPVYFSSLIFQLPGISIEVAPECSGLRSTLALFMTSLVAAHMLLRSNWRRTALIIVVIPLALLRNGFRVYVIGQLCVSIGPEMINSYIHRRGGPYFFLLSLVPLLAVLLVLMKSERSVRPMHAAEIQ